MTSPEQRREYRRQWRIKNPEYAAKWYQKNKDSVIKRVRLWEILNSEKVKRYRREWARLNPDKRKPAQIKWKQRNPDKMRESSRRRRLNPHHRIRETLSSRINHAINKRSCGIKTIDVLGCSLKDFIIYMESKFEVGMNWSNYGRGEGQWSVDHEIPCALFDLTKPEHRYRCFHFSNLQPMWHVENIRKQAKITTNQFNLL